MQSSAGTESVWLTDVELPRFPSLDAPGTVEVLVVGGGLSGLTAALLLQRAGFRTIVFEQHRIGHGETGRTSAHLTVLPDAGFSRIIADFGEEAARAVARSKRDAIRLIETLSAEMDAGFARVPGYLYTEREADVRHLEREAASCRAAGVTLVEQAAAPLPFRTVAALELPDQAQFHPARYLRGIVRLYAEAGGAISERTHVQAIDEDDSVCRVRTERGVAHARFVLALTDAPIVGGAWLDTRLRACRSYLLAAQLDRAEVPAGLYWDMEEPYHYIRVAETRAGPIALIGGEDHRVGTSEAPEAFEALEAYARTRLPIAGISARWSGQIIDPVDGLPYIGPSAAGSRVLLATGYAGNGLTFGTVAAQLLADLVAGRANPHAELYATDRPLAAREWARYAAHNLPAAWTLVTDMLPHPLTTPLGDIAPGHGEIVRVDGTKVAAARDRDGVLHLVSPTCSHMGCDVAWNAVEQSWDCPCHGSRYDVDGRVIHGPATIALERLEEKMAG